MNFYKKLLLVVKIALIILFLNNIVYANDKSMIECKIYNLEGYHMLESADYNEAIKIFEEVIEINPRYAVAYNNLGASYYRLKKYDKAIEAFKKAISLKENYIKAYINLATSYFWKGKYISAYRYYLKAKRIDKGYVESRLDLGDAKAQVEKKMRDNPNDERLKKIYNRILEYEKNNK